MRLIKWSKLPILGSAVLAGYVIGKVTCSTGVGETPAILKMKKSAQKLLVGGLRLTSDLLSVGADLLSPKAEPRKK